MNRLHSKMSLLYIILLTISIYTPTQTFSEVPNNPLKDNAKQSENLNVASIDSITATNQLYSVTSRTGNPGNNESICIDGYQSSNIAGLNDIIASSIVVRATLKNALNSEYNSIEWFVNENKVQTGGETYTFDATEKSYEKYVIQAKLGESKKVLNIFVVRCRFIIAVQNTDTGNPISISTDSMISSDFAGHTSWFLQIIPSEASKAVPFARYDFYCNKFIGFHAESKTVAYTGISLSPTPLFHIPDTIFPDKTKYYPVNSAMMTNMLSETYLHYAIPGNYVLGTRGNASLLGVQIFSWTHPSSRNCVTTTLNIGINNGLSNVIPATAGYDFWSGKIGAFDVQYEGYAPSFLYLDL